MSTACARTSNWAMVAASSNSLFVTSPVGLDEETRRAGTDAGHFCRQSMGRVRPSGRGTKWTPPKPRPEASHAPFVAGMASGTISAISVGREPTSSTSQRKSCRNAWVWVVSRTRLPSLDFRASWRTEKRPMTAGMARAIDRSSPSTCCHFFNDTRRWVVAMDDRIARRRRRRCSGRDIVLSRVLMIQPRIVLTVDHVASPLAIFFVEAGSWRKGESWPSKGRRTVSSVCNSARLTRRRVRVPPCTRPRKSST
jgi:hypothetical protein